MRRTELDLCRITACLGVILSHAAADGFGMVPLDSGRFRVLCMVSTGADFRLRCLGCGHEVIGPRSKFEKNIRQVQR